MKHLAEISDEDDLRQGDIIMRKYTEEGQTKVQWGFILNADCDIAQGKNASLITWLEIISSKTFVEKFWSVAQIRKILDKQLPQVCQSLNGAIKRKQNGLRTLKPSDLEDWLLEDNADEILRKIGSRDKNLLERMRALQNAVKANDSENKLDCLLACTAVLGPQTNKLTAEIMKSLRGGGFTDTVLVPGLPIDFSKGFVVLLRHISSLHQDQIHKTEADARINNKSMEFFRIGRFSDNLRYQIVQKLSFLYSRIGSPEEFEQACDIAAHLLAEDAIPVSGGAG